MTRSEFIHSMISDFGRTYSNVLPVKSKIETLAGMAYDAKYSNVVTVTDNLTLTADDSGKVYIVTADAKNITLPAVAEGLNFRFINGGADGAVLLKVTPVSSAVIGTIANAAADSVAGGVDGKYFGNTKATANKGDWCELLCDGADWFIVGGVGIWASEA